MRYLDDEGEGIEVHDDQRMVGVLFDGYELWTYPENLTIIEETDSHG